MNKRNNLALQANFVLDDFVFLAKVCNVNSLFAPKNTEDVLVFKDK